MVKRLVSVLTPCYNGEKVIFRLLDSILRQTYSDIEMFVIDDGSTDDSAQLIKSYIPKFRKKGYTLRYIYQANSGQSVAINNGLKLISGEYLVWPDSDDFYASDTVIETLVDSLKKTDDTIGMTRCIPDFLEESSLEVIQEAQFERSNNGNLFQDCLFGQNGFWFVPGGYMLKTELLFKVLPSKSIFTSYNAGQNWQIYLPMLHSYRCLTISEILYHVLVRSNSHSRGQYTTFEDRLLKMDAYEQTILETLKTIPSLDNKDLILYTKRIRIKYAKIRMRICLSTNNIGEFNTLYKEKLYGQLNNQLINCFVFFSRSRFFSKMLYSLLCFYRRIKKQR